MHADPPAGNVDAAEAAPDQPAKPPKKNPPKTDWTALQDEWKICRFGGEGPQEIKKELITLGFGDPLTGVRWDGDHPDDNYEIELEARRTDGFDFFAAITFPVKDENCSLVLGGWGGGVTGISSINGLDASNNETTVFRQYKNDQWYKIRIRVDPNEINCWVDEQSVIEIEREGLKFDIRAEMDPTLPLGIANFQCDSELRNIRSRKLHKDELTETSDDPASPADQDNQEPAE